MDDEKIEIKLTYKQTRELLLAELALDTSDHEAITTIKPRKIYPQIQFEKYNLISRVESKSRRNTKPTDGDGKRMTYIVETSDDKIIDWIKYIKEKY